MKSSLFSNQSFSTVSVRSGRLINPENNLVTGRKQPIADIKTAAVEYCLPNPDLGCKVTIFLIEQEASTDWIGVLCMTMPDLVPQKSH